MEAVVKRIIKIDQKTGVESWASEPLQEEQAAELCYELNRDYLYNPVRFQIMSADYKLKGGG
jgi:hypothetical protein